MGHGSCGSLTGQLNDGHVTESRLMKCDPWQLNIQCVCVRLFRYFAGAFCHVTWYSGHVVA